MQINGVGNNQIGNSYQNPNRMPNSTTGKNEGEEASKRLEALGVKVELSFRQTGAQEQEVVKESAETEKPQEAFSVLGWIKKIWDAGIAWLKSIWNDEAAVTAEEPGTFEGDLTDAEMFEAEAELVAETPLVEDADYVAVHTKGYEGQHNTPTVTQMTGQTGQFDYGVTDEERVSGNTDKFRTVGTPLHTSGMQDSYNRYGQHSKLGVESSNNMQIRK